MRKYKTTYQDKNGTESFYIESDGSDMFFTLRGIDFEGHDFEMLGGAVDHDKFDYDLYEDGSGDLTNFNISLEIPILLFDSNSNSTFTETLIAHVEVGKSPTENLKHGLQLSTSFGNFEYTKKITWMEDDLIALQKELPENIYLKTCLSCKYSNYSPFGNGMFGSIYCFKNLKSKLPHLRDKSDLFNIWTREAMDKGDIFSVQETFDCSEHQLPTEDDWVYKNWTKFV